MNDSRPAIACLGAGRMGRGIAVAFAYAGHPVTMIDVKERTAEQFAKLETAALGEIRATLATMTKLGMLCEADAEIVINRVAVAPARESTEVLAATGLVFEGVPE